MQALQDRVVLELKEIESPQGIIIGNTQNGFGENPPTRGVVVSVGEGYMTDAGVIRPINLKEGDIVYFMKHSGAPLEKRGEDGRLVKFRVIRYSSILVKE